VKTTAQQLAYLDGCMSAYPQELRDAVAKHRTQEEDTVLSVIHQSKRSVCRLMVAGTKLQAEHPRLAHMPVFFEKTPSATAEFTSTLHEQNVTNAIANETCGLAPLPLGASDGVYRSEWVNGTTLSSLSPIPKRELSVVDMVRGVEPKPATEAMASYWNHLERAQAALDGLHDAGYYHGDAHLGNFMIEPNGTPRLVDLARAEKLPGGQSGENAKSKDFQTLAVESYRVCCLWPNAPAGRLRDLAQSIGKEKSGPSLQGSGAAMDQNVTLDGPSLDRTLSETPELDVSLRETVAMH